MFLKSVFTHIVLIINSTALAYSSVEIEELLKAQKTKDPQVLILDVRTPGEYSQGHIPNSRNIDFRKVSSHINEIKKYKKVYVYCKVGGRARRACKTLEFHGLNPKCADKFGFDKWKTQSLPIQR